VDVAAKVYEIFKLQKFEPKKIQYFQKKKKPDWFAYLNVILEFYET